jgi:hypothetical protein
MDRALFCNWNTGVEIVPVQSRALHGYDNVGFEAVPVPSRALHGNWNAGIEPLTVPGRALTGFWSVTVYTSESDPVEFRLLGINLYTVEAILRGK